MNLGKNGKSGANLRGFRSDGWGWVLLFTVGALWAITPGWAQSGYATGTVRGTVFDAAGAVVHAAEDGWLGEVAQAKPVRTTGAAGNQSCALLNSFVDQALHTLILPRIGNRTHGG